MERTLFIKESLLSSTLPALNAEESGRRGDANVIRWKKSRFVVGIRNPSTTGSRDAVDKNNDVVSNRQAVEQDVWWRGGTISCTASTCSILSHFQFAYLVTSASTDLISREVCTCVMTPCRRWREWRGVRVASRQPSPAVHFFWFLLLYFRSEFAG